MLFRRDLPELLEAKPEFLWFTSARQIKLCNQLFAEIAARTFRQQRVFGPQFHAAGETVLGLAILADTHIACRNAHNRPFFVKENVGGSKTGIDLDTEGFCFRRQPATDTAE